MGRYIILRMYRQSPDGRARWGYSMADRHEDDDVIVRAKSGDESAWRELYEAHAGRLQAWLRSRPSGDSAEDSDDVAATSWLTAADKIADFHGSTDDFGGWLFVIVRNTALNQRRRTIRRATSPFEVDGNDARIWGADDDGTVLVDDMDGTRRLLAELSPREAEVVALVDVVGLDTATAASIIGISHSSIRVTRHRAMKRLRKIAEQLEM